MSDDFFAGWTDLGDDRGAEIACFYSSATLVGKINSTARESQNKH